MITAFLHAQRMKLLCALVLILLAGVGLGLPPQLSIALAAAVYSLAAVGFLAGAPSAPPEPLPRDLGQN